MAPDAAKYGKALMIPVGVSLRSSEKTSGVKQSRLSDNVKFGECVLPLFFVRVGCRFCVALRLRRLDTPGNEEGEDPSQDTPLRLDIRPGNKENCLVGRKSPISNRLRRFRRAGVREARLVDRHRRNKIRELFDRQGIFSVRFPNKQWQISQSALNERPERFPEMNG
jgi:hypothetical protein